MSNESFGRGAWERPTRPARPTQPPSKPPGATLGKTWQDVRKELYTLEEIAESDRRVAFLRWLGSIYEDPDPECLFCIANTGAHCPAIKDGKLDVDLCRSYLFQSFLLTHRSDDND